MKSSPELQPPKLWTATLKLRLNPSWSSDSVEAAKNGRHLNVSEPTKNKPTKNILEKQYNTACIAIKVAILTGVRFSHDGWRDGCAIFLCHVFLHCYEMCGKTFGSYHTIIITKAKTRKSCTFNYPNPVLQILIVHSSMNCHRILFATCFCCSRSKMRSPNVHPYLSTLQISVCPATQQVVSTGCGRSTKATAVPVSQVFSETDA